MVVCLRYFNLRGAFSSFKGLRGVWEAAKVANLLKSDAPASALFSRLAALAGGERFAAARTSFMISSGSNSALTGLLPELRSI